MRDFWFSCCFVSKPSAVCLQWEFAGIKTGEKLLEFTRGTKGLLCRRIWRTRPLSLPLPSFLFSPCQRAPASSTEEVGCCPDMEGARRQGDGCLPCPQAAEAEHCRQKGAILSKLSRIAACKASGQASCSLPWLCPSQGRQGGLCCSMGRQHPKKSPKGWAGSAVLVDAPVRCSPMDEGLKLPGPACEQGCCRSARELSIAPGTLLGVFFFYFPLSSEISPQNVTASDHMQLQGSDQL